MYKDSLRHDSDDIEVRCSLDYGILAHRAPHQSAAEDGGLHVDDKTAQATETGGAGVELDRPHRRALFVVITCKSFVICIADIISSNCSGRTNQGDVPLPAQIISGGVMAFGSRQCQ